MIEIPTLFILGAGASKPYGYPTGSELRKDIIDNYLNHFNSLPDVTSSSIPDIPRIRRDIEQFIKTFSDSSIVSIDKYLAFNPIDAYLGKFAITLFILNSERNSNFSGSNEDWYEYLFNRMISSFNKPEDFQHFSKNKVAFITYNYDRSLEYFLHSRFHNSFHQNRHDFEKKIKDYVPFPIIHVYGQAENFHTITWPDHNYGADFNNFLSVERLSKNIKVIGEDRSGDEKTKKQVRDLLADYKRIFFLGFSYAQDNLDAIDLPNNINNDWRIFGTAMGMTGNEIEEARSRINIKFPDYARTDPRYSNPVLKNLDSCALLRQHL